MQNIYALSKAQCYDCLIIRKYVLGHNQFQAYESAGISLVEENKMEGEICYFDLQKDLKKLKDTFYDCKNDKKNSLV